MAADSLRACLVWPTPNLNCHYDRCAPATAARLRALPSWGGAARGTGRGAGRNHLVFDYIDAPRVRCCPPPRPLPPRPSTPTYVITYWTT